MLTNDGISVGDALALRGYDNNDGFGGNNSWWIVLLVLLIAGGWNNGFGIGGIHTDIVIHIKTSDHHLLMRKIA